MTAKDPNKSTELCAENARLVALLEAHGIEWRIPPISTQPLVSTLALEAEPSSLSTGDKITLFRRLFRGRTDVYPIRWESKKTGKSGYAPACANEWRSGICDKPRIKCSDCGNRLLNPLTDALIYGHLAGHHTIGVYPLLADDTCHFLAVDFDEADWRDDAIAFVQSCRELSVPVALEISRSGDGAHAWIFFATSVLARDARRLGTAIISHTCTRTRQLRLSSYDRLFPNQDIMPKGGFGNLIALPLQKKPREQGCSVFVDDALRPHPDQWAFLAAIQPMGLDTMDAAILLATGRSHPLDVTFITEEDQKEPWKQTSLASNKLPGKMPKSLKVTLANLVYFEKAKLPQPLANRLIRLAAFQNPEFYKAQAMRLPIWDKPRVIGCAENYPKHIALPRGCLEAAVAELIKHDIGILCAPTAFGKTVAAAAMIARRGVNTLILVHRTELLKQWQERLHNFLGARKETVGTIGGGKSKPTGRIDIAVMQSLTRKGEVSALVENYGQIIVDECHHLSAFSFEGILKRAKAKYVLGLTATPVRRDGHQPIIFMQCGLIRYTAAKPENATHTLEVMPKMLPAHHDLPQDAAIQNVFRYLASDAQRTEFVAATIVHAYQEGRRILVLTERTDHLDFIEQKLLGVVDNLFTLHGRMSKKQRAQRIEELNHLPPEIPRVLLATGRLIGEGFDHPPLDTLVLAMPISWKGTLQQYAGRLHREHATKTDVRIYDYVDAGHSVLLRMWDRRQKGYKAMGYVIH